MTEPVSPAVSSEIQQAFLAAKHASTRGPGTDYIDGIAAARRLIEAEARADEQRKVAEYIDAVTADIDRLVAEARADERHCIADGLSAKADNYPEDVFPADSETRDAMSGTAFRAAYTIAARLVRDGDL